jgi:hypothetical protein
MLTVKKAEAMKLVVVNGHEKNAKEGMALVAFSLQ